MTLQSGTEGRAPLKGTKSEAILWSDCFLAEEEKTREGREKEISQFKQQNFAFEREKKSQRKNEIREI